MAYFKRGQLIERPYFIITDGTTTALSQSSPKVIRLSGENQHTIKLPSAEGLDLNHGYIIRNKSTNTVDVTDNNSTLLTTVPPDLDYGLFVSDNTSAAGQWDLAISGSSGGGDVGAALSPHDGYRLLIFDYFQTRRQDPASLVHSYTNASYLASDMLYRMMCDKSRAVTTTGTSYTLNGAPSFSLSIGDVIYDYASKKMRRVASVTSPVAGTLDAAFDTNLSLSNCMVSQALWTKDLTEVGNSLQKNRAKDLFPGASINSIHLNYNDSLAIADSVSDFVDTARMAVFATSAGAQSDTSFPATDLWGSIYKRELPGNTVMDYGMPTNTAMERLFICFIPNPDNSAVTLAANLLNYEASFIYDDAELIASVSESAFCFTDASTPPLNCANPVVVGGKTRVALNFTYAGNIHPNRTTGELDVILDGRLLPRYLSGYTTGRWWREVPGASDTIELNTDYSSLNYSLEIKRRTTESGDANYNLIKINALQDITVGTPNDVETGAANYSSLQAAIDSAETGNRIVILNSTALNGNVVVNKRLTIEGLGGYDSFVNGTATLGANCVFGTFKNFRVSQFITDAAAVGNVIQNCFWSTDPIDAGSANSIIGINIT